MSQVGYSIKDAALGVIDEDQSGEACIFRHSHAPTYGAAGTS